MQAAVASESAEAQPAVTRAAGQSSSSAMRLPTASRRSSSRTYFLEATCIAATASGRISDPVKAVYVPAALMKERMPSSWITSRPFAATPVSAWAGVSMNCKAGKPAIVYRTVLRLILMRLIVSLRKQWFRTPMDVARMGNRRPRDAIRSARQ